MPIRTRTPEQIERGAKLIDALCALFHPFVEAACKPKIESEMALPPPKIPVDEEGIAQLSEFLRQSAKATGVPADEAERTIKEAEELLRDPKPFTAEEIARAVKEESENECAQLVRNWLNSFFLLDADDDAGRVVDGSLLDDAMLPPLAGEDKECFERACVQGLLDAADTRAVLRQVKATLTPGQPMPAEAIEFLELEDIVVIR